MNLKEIRVSRRLKVQEVSDYLNCLPSVYSRYENGKREPSIDILLKLSKLYGVSVDCLIGNDEVVDTSMTMSQLNFSLYSHSSKKCFMPPTAIRRIGAHMWY